jgi:hypothetical protein
MNEEVNVDQDYSEERNHRPFISINDDASSHHLLPQVDVGAITTF